MNRKGLIASLVSSMTFAVFSYLASILNPINGLDIWAWRILLTLPGMILALLISRRFNAVTNEIKRVLNKPQKLLAYAFTAPMLAVQMWLFGWAPQSGYTLYLTIGYFIMPLVMVVIGRLLYKEKISSLSKVATALALLAVIWELVRVGEINWVTLVVALGYPAYFTVRRYFKTDGVGALALEMAFALPFALGYLLKYSDLYIPLHSPRILFLLILLAMVSVVGTALYVVAARLLPYGVFGIISYLEPALVTIVAVVIGERITGSQWGTYIGMWAAVAILGLDGIYALVKHRASPLIAARPWRRRRRRQHHISK